VRSPTNAGFSHACNAGAREASGEILVFLNNDVEVTQGFIAPLLCALDPEGAEGIACTHGRDVLIARDAKDFAGQAMRVMEDTGLREQLRNSARRLVESRYGWDGIGDTLEALLVDTVGRA
jgi:glycosyltransferase involved in cell wall biosynthesis